jgi:glycoside/pentoside/hexuronide:cation symporter, GPH family
MTDTTLALGAAPSVAARPRLPLSTKLAFGAGDLGPAIVTAINGFFLLNFLVNVAGVRPAVAGLIFGIIKIWDAVNDPLIGWLSDRTVSRFGRRRPWLLFGAIPFGLAFYLHWLVPPLGDSGKFFYYLVVGLLLDTAWTAVLVPYTALTPELTQDYDERTSLTSVRLSFSVVGGVLAAFFHTQIVGAFPDAMTGNAVSAAVWAVVITVPWFITFAGTRQAASAASPAASPSAPQLGFVAGLRLVFRNRAFVLVALVYLLSWLALQLVQTNLLFYVNDWIGLDLSAFGYLLLAIQFSSLVWVLIWARVSERIGKQGVYYLGATVFILVEIGLFFVRPGQTGLVYALAVLAGVGIAVVYLVPWSMLPDVVEMDELETGQRREGVYYGFFAFLQKLGLSAGLALSGLMLDLAGYIPQAAAQPPSVLLTLRLLVGPGGAVLLLLSLVAVYFYPITRAKHAEMRAALDSRRAAQP